MSQCENKTKLRLFVYAALIPRSLQTRLGVCSVNCVAEGHAVRVIAESRVIFRAVSGSSQICKEPNRPPVGCAFRTAHPGASDSEQ